LVLVDAAGLAMLLRNGTLPKVWIPPAALRDWRGLLRTRLALRRHTTTLKNRIHGAIRRYGQWQEGEARNLFQGKGRVQLSVYVGGLPEETRIATRHEWELIDVDNTSGRKPYSGTGEAHPSGDRTVGYGALVALFAGRGGDSQRHYFAGDRRGAALRVRGAVSQLRRAHAHRACQRRPDAHGSDLAPGQPLFEVGVCGGGRLHGDAETPLRRPSRGPIVWAFRAAKNHGKAAVARHLAEASWWMLTTKQSYREPAPASRSSSEKPGTKMLMLLEGG
jgi:hypothetical protein